MYIHILETRSMTSKYRVHWRETETAGEREREREREREGSVVVVYEGL